jgi:hypothetical protein
VAIKGGGGDGGRGVDTGRQRRGVVWWKQESE